MEQTALKRGYSVANKQDLQVGRRILPLFAIHSLGRDQDFQQYLESKGQTSDVSDLTLATVIAFCQAAPRPAKAAGGPSLEG